MSKVGCENVTYHGCQITDITTNMRKKLEGVNIEIEGPIDDAYFKVKGEIWFNQETGSCFKTGVIQFMIPFEGVDVTGSPRGGSCFNRV